ncbi:MAG: molecular chaperone HtpG [Rhodospirillales bacterium]|nr:molecular chaperone HtpG [Rhodospirillales bacterium]MBO6788098.1 molecular chaperone HtpG [Rhodospirillales bacterium]
MSKETYSFQAEVGKILDIVAHSLYSHKEVFLRELISNASDACDKLRYRMLTEPDLVQDSGAFEIGIRIDSKAKTLTVTDNGIGMSKDDLIDSLGTIAKSGTQAFMEGLKEAQAGGDEAKMALIGQFGVGFYSSFMVADKVEVLSRKAGEDKAWRWTSDGHGAFEIEEAERDGHGSDVIVHVKKDAKEFLEGARVENIVKTYSDHIAQPVVLKAAKDGEQDKTLNSASALWTRDKKDITDEQYNEFYHHVGMAFDQPWMTLHNKAEGVISYTNLLFIPTSRPFDLFHPERKGHLKLYVNRVFITDDCDALIPGYLRFVKGIVDSEDIDLNVSREMLQHNPAVAKIRKALVKRVLGELKKKADKKPEEYAEFWETFGMVLKEGIHEDFDNRDRLLELTRFKSSAVDGWTSLKDYVERMKDGQDAIYYISADDAEQAARSPQLEGFRAKEIEVLFMTDPVDEFWMPAIGQFEEKPFKSATRGGVDLSKIKDAEGADEKDAGDEKDETVSGIEALTAAFKLALGDRIKDVRASTRLTDSPVCLVADEGDMDMHLERLLKAHNQLDAASPRVLEVNPKHALIKRLAGIAEKSASDKALDDAAFLLLDQARIVEGEPVVDPQDFIKRMTAVMQKGLAA